MKTSLLPYWVRLTNHCPVKFITGQDHSQDSAESYFKILRNLIKTPVGKRALKNALEWAKTEQRARDNFVRDLADAPPTVAYGFKSQDRIHVARRREFYERLATYNASRPTGFGVRPKQGEQYERPNIRRLIREWERSKSNVRRIHA